MKVKDIEFEPFVSEAELDGIVRRLAAELSRDYAGRQVVVCPILTGAFMFASDLVKRLAMPCEIEFVRYTSYSGMQSTGEVNCSMPFPSSVKGKDVLIVEDVVDTGLSMRQVLAEARRAGARSVEVCTLFFKPGAFKGDYEVRYIGREIGNEFIVGYGMDYDEQGRTLPEVLVKKS